MAVATARMPRARRRVVTVDEVRRQVAEEREAAAAIVPTAARVEQAMRAVLAPYLSEVLTLRFGGGARGESMEVRLGALYGAGALLSGRARWVSYRDIYTDHAAILAPAAARDAMLRAVGRLRRGAPRPKGGD